MHEELLTESCIDCNDFNEFKAIFSNTSDFKPVNWISGKSQLYYFIQLMVKLNIIDIENQPKFWLITSYCFLDKGSPISSVKLGKSKPPSPAKRLILERIVAAYGQWPS